MATAKTPRSKATSSKSKKTLDGLIIGVDLDGVCADFYAKMRDVAAEWFERPIDQLPADVSYGLPEWGLKGVEDYERLHRFAVTQRDLFGSSQMIRGARKYLRMLSNEGARIRIITHRLFIYYFHEKAVVQTTKWLDYHGIPYVDLCFLKEKEQVGADIYVEDTPKNVLALRAKNLYTICFSNSTNRDVAEPRALDWEQTYGLIHEEAKRRKKAGEFPRRSEG